MTFRKSIGAMLLVMGLMVWSAPICAGKVGTIQVSDLRMRSGPGTRYGVIGTLPKGARVYIIASQKGWLEIEHNGTKGYILEDANFIDTNDSQITTHIPQAHSLKDSAPGAEKIKGKLHKAQTELATITHKERAVLEEFYAADEALNIARQKVRMAKIGLDKILSEIDRVEARAKTLERAIVNGEQYASRRLVALYKLNWVGKTQLLATADSFIDFVNRKDALERILSKDEERLEELHHNKTALTMLLTELNTRRAEKHAAEQSLQKRITKLSSQQKKRKALLQTIESKKSLGLAAVVSLSQAARKLDATFTRIDPVGMNRFPKDENSRDKPFAAYKGLLSWPVKGKITSFFGPYEDKKFAVRNFRSGINIQAERGEPIRSVLNGHVIFSNWFKGFGNMMIIDHGNHYYTVYAHLEEVFKVKGDRVDQGEVIATVGDSGSMKGPALHFEIRHHGKPIDPLHWIKKG